MQLHRAARRLKETQRITADRPPRGAEGRGRGGTPARSCPPPLLLKTRGRRWRSETQRGPSETGRGGRGEAENDREEEQEEDLGGGTGRVKDPKAEKQTAPARSPASDWPPPLDHRCRRRAN